MTRRLISAHLQFHVTKTWVNQAVTVKTSMQPKASRNHPLTVDQVRRNLRIAKKRSPGERLYSVMKRIMNGGHTFITMVRRDRVRAMFLCHGYNMLTLIALKKQGRIVRFLEK